MMVGIDVTVSIFGSDVERVTSYEYLVGWKAARKSGLVSKPSLGAVTR